MKKTFKIYIITTILIVLLFISGCQKKYTVTFMDYNGTVLSEQIVKQSEDATPPTIPLREGYEFIGWSKEYTNIQEDIVLIAQYKKVINTYTVRFLDYDNTLLKTEQIEENGNATPPSTPSREGYEFIGWDQNYINVKQNLDIYAQYKEIITYTVTFMDYNGTILSKQTIKQSENATPPSTPSREGYKFVGWNNDYTNVQDDIIITAQYEKIINTYTVSFISYDNIIVEIQSVEKGEKALEPTSPLREGYIFNGWYLNEEKWSFIGYSITSDIILEAKWTAIQYNIMYELNGGETNNPTTYTVEDKIILTSPKKTGYTFLGWTTEESDTPILELSFTNETGNKTFTANYQINVYNISYELNGGIANNPTTYTVEYKIILTNPKKTGYAFLGWTTEESDTPILELSFSNETGNKLFTANWINLSFVLTENDEYEISGMTNTYDSKVIVPEYYNKKKIVSIGNSAFYNCRSLTSITIPESVTSIGDSAFYYCNNLTSIIIPEGVTSIGNYAFYSCASLTSITIPDSVTSIGDSAFYYCNSLTSINVSENNQYYKSTDGNLYSKDGKTLIQYAIGKQEKTFKIPNSVTSIGDSAFYSCDSLTSITIPEGVTSIGEYAFSSCDSLTSITIPEGVTSIGEYAFSSCNNLTSITIPEGVTSIGDGAFCECNLTSITIPESVTSIGNYAFSWCASLTSITIPDSVTSIGDSAFYYCNNLTSINVSENNQYYKSMDGNLYSKDGKTLIQYAIGKQEKTFKIPNSVTSIGDSAFYSCDSLTSIAIPESVTSIGVCAFEYCRSLTSIIIPEGVTSIGVCVFNNCTGLTNIIIPEGVTSIGNHAFGSCRSLTSITIPESVTSIGDYAFGSCRSLTSITIPSSVTSIGDSAFYSCDSLTSIAIPDSVTSIGDSAFYSCDSLTSIAIPESVTSIGDCAFYSCDSLTSITIPESVTSIGDSAFRYCTSLTSITIPEGVTSIGDSAFRYCTSLTIYCVASSKPSGWSSGWNYDNRPVVWNYTL